MRSSFLCLAIASIQLVTALQNSYYMNTTTINSQSSVLPSVSSTVPMNSTNASMRPTNSSNATLTSPSPTPAPTSNCCYLYPRWIGMNTWWSSSYDMTVATALTYWQQRGNSTAVVLNSTTITVPNATQILGEYRWGDTIPGLPTNLLDYGNAWEYGKTFVGGPGAVTYTDQNNLVIQSPTPFFEYSGMQAVTNLGCQATITRDDCIDTTVVETVDMVVYTELPRCTYTDFTTGDADLDGEPIVTGYIADPFPAGDYSNFTYQDWLKSHGQHFGPVGDGDLLSQKGDLVALLTGIPFVVSQYPNIGDCTYLSGWGEPSVHIPVNTLTVTVHSTLSLPGSYGGHAPTTTPALPIGNPLTTIAPTSVIIPYNPTAKPSSAHPSVGQPLSHTLETDEPVNTNKGKDPVDPIPTRQTSIKHSVTGGIIATVITESSDHHDLTATHGSPVHSNPGVVVSNKHTTKTIPVGVVTTIGGQHISVISNGVVVSHDHTIATVSAGKTTIVNGQHISVPSNVVLGPTATFAPGAVTTVGEVTVSAASDGNVVVAHHGSTATVAAGGSTIINGQFISAPPNPEGAGVTLSPDSSPTTIEGHVISAAPNGGAVVVQNGNTATLNKGQATTINGQTVSVNSDGGVIINNRQGTPTTLPPESATIIGGQVVSVMSNGDVLVAHGGTTATLAPGSVTTIDGQVISAASGSAVIIGPEGTTETISPQSATTIGGETISVLSNGNVLIAHDGTTATLTSGSVTTIDGEIISAGSSGAVIYTDDSPMAMETIAADAATTVAGEVISAIPSGGVVVINSITTFTIPAGSSTVFNGEYISAASSSGGMISDESSASHTSDGSASSTDDSPSHSPSKDAGHLSVQADRNSMAAVVVGIVLCIFN